MRPIDADALIENLQGSKVTTDSKDMDYKTMWQLLCTLVVETIENEPTVLPSADAVSDAYKRGFEDCKRAYEIELARSAGRKLTNLRGNFESAVGEKENE